MTTKGHEHMWKKDCTHYTPHLYKMRWNFKCFPNSKVKTDRRKTEYAKECEEIKKRREQQQKSSKYETFLAVKIDITFKTLWLKSRENNSELSEIE